MKNSLPIDVSNTTLEPKDWLALKLTLQFKLSRLQGTEMEEHLFLEPIKIPLDEHLFRVLFSA